MSELQRITLLSVFDTGPGKPVVLAIKTAQTKGTLYASLSHAEALTMAEALIRKTRVSLFGTKDAPIMQPCGPIDPTGEMGGESMDMAAFYLREMVRLLPATVSTPAIE